MKIPIKINGKSYKIRPVLELSTRDFLKFTKVKEYDIMKYIAFETGVKYKEAFFAILSPAVDKAIGQIPDITKVKRPKLDYVDYTKEVWTVGQRHQIEDAKKDGYELLVFALAVAQAQSPNIDDVNKLVNNYMDKPFIEVLPAGFFFFKKLLNGRGKEVSFFARLMALIGMRD